MPEVYEVVLNVKGAGRKEIISPDTYSKEDAEREVAVIRQVQQKEDEWLELPWLSVKGTNVIAAFLQPANAPRPTPNDPPPSDEELVQQMIEFIEQTGLKVIRTDGQPWDADTGEVGRGDPEGNN